MFVYPTLLSTLLSISQVKVLGAIKKGADLKHVDAPVDGLKDDQKKAFVEDRKDKTKK